MMVVKLFFICMFIRFLLLMYVLLEMLIFGLIVFVGKYGGVVDKEKEGGGESYFYVILL